MERREQVVLENMCMIRDGSKVLVEDKIGKDIRGIIFPGGHVEEHEPIVDSVIREVKEETGLTVYFYDNYRQISDYIPFGKIRKRVVFFLAEARYPNVRIQRSEIDTYTWVSFPQAQAMCRYDNDIRVLKKAENMVNSPNKKLIRKNPVQ